MDRCVRLTGQGLFALVFSGVVFCAGAVFGGMIAASMVVLERRSVSLWIGLVLALMLAVPAGWALGNLARERRFAARAQPFPGVVTGLSDVQGGVRVDYVFQDASGQEVTGKDYVPYPGPLEKGQAITVLACARSPHRSKLYPLFFFHVVISRR